ncbi:stalk domain-containing protein [Paenibacillus harenae]|uniref:stalk domain-containing protein n=1 Tax=Paenibacillus harenae TaxID=306543 RepID=UPI00279389C8|nr:hypothetical protein [Paenibacillus harenae]MDQ0063122.1 hypothetical protein [Paenibacillus harenae]
MQMKKMLAVSMLAATLGVTAVNPVFAQTPVKQEAVQFSQTTFLVNANPAVLRSIQASGTTLVSVRDFAKAIGADLQLADGSVTLTLDGKSVYVNPGAGMIAASSTTPALSSAAKMVNYTIFADPSALVEALGGTYEADADAPAIATVEQLTFAEHAVWAGGARLIVSNSSENGREDYLVNAANGKYELLLSSANTSDLVVSPNGQSAAYTDANGAVYVIDLNSKESKQVSTDSSIKNELQWSQDGTALFYLQGDKSSVIAKVNLADGTVTKVLEDKVDYKANLDVSADGMKFAYTVNKQPKVTADSSVDVALDDVAIDAAGTEAQVYFYNSAAADNKPVQLTKDTDDKVFIELAADGSKVYYVSVTADDASLGKAASVSTSGTEAAPASVFAQKDVYQLAQGAERLYLLTANDDSTNAVYEFDTVIGESKLIGAVSDSVSEIIVSRHGHLAALIDGQLAVSVNGQWKNVTH